MTTRIPVKAIFDGSNVTALGEFVSGDSISTVYTDAKVVSVAGQTGDISNAQLQAAVSGTGVLTTANVSEVTNLYFTNARVYSNVVQLNYATVSYVDNSISNVLGSAPAVLDTLQELASAVNNDPGFFTNVASAGTVTFNQANAAYARANVAIESLTTANVTELTNLYFTNARARAAISVTGDGSYNPSTGVITINTTDLSSYATTTYVGTAISNLVASAPATLDTLNELAAALGNDNNFATSTATLIGAARDRANTAYVAATAGFDSGNTIALSAAAGFDRANTAYVAAVAAFDSSNTKVTTVAGVTSTTVSNIQLASGISQTGIFNTSNVIEGSNLYYTIERANTAIDNRVTKAFVDALNVDADTLDGLDSSAFALDTDLTTANVAELTNLYFTNARATAAVTNSSLSNITLSRVNNTADGTGQIFLNGANGNRIDWNTEGIGVPTFTTRSVGTKLTLYPTLGASAVDYAIGINSGAMWSSIPGNDAGQFFRWYGGTTEVANLSGTGTFTVGTLQTAGNVDANNLRVVTNSSLGTVVSGMWNGSSISTTYTDAKVISVNGSTGVVTGLATTSNLALKANIADLTTANVAEVTNLYYSNARVYANVAEAGYAGIGDILALAIALG